MLGFASAGVAQTIGGSKFVRGLTKAGQGIARIMAGGLASVAGGGKFKNGAITAAFAYAFNELRYQATKPDFDAMSDQGLVDWIKDHASEFGIELRDGVEIYAVDEYRLYDEKLRVWAECNDVLCGGMLDSPIMGHYDARQNVIELFKPAFEAGVATFAVSQAEVVAFRNLSRAAIAVSTIGHEAARSIGVDMIGEIAPVHFNAEKAGISAMKKFRVLYE